MKKSILLSLFLTLAYQPLARALQMPAEPACSASTQEKDVCSTSILALHPTQFTLGMIEIDARAAKLEQKSQTKFDKYMKKHLVPVVIGPNRVFYMTDHHHLSMALYKDGLRTINVTVTHDWSAMSPAQFWSQMEATQQVYLFDDGRGPLSPETLPANILQMTDDVYRSLAWAVIDQTGAIQDSNVLFAKFLWADFFRTRIPVATVQNNFEQAVQTAAQLAQSPAAKGLPGYTGK